ncbi:RNA polymerase subunit sigma-70 [Pseudomonas sp. HLS-6]|uniref:sigma factor-like helix-turn-helix DNA-binding protein n=1 Tax=Pseudomonas sp. HLS-6 TaxID=2049589 RepID=UPI000C17BAA3|nr:sigma factor-like helix-turn-helix DNA-binding protein [Pseudomonas sp. HLS-6]ATR83561.1 RNA polymerase subunit sigma-70 [Pseudomonas sp. HLS-6]
MTPLLLPLESPALAAPGDQALLQRLKKLPRRAQQVFLLSRLDQWSFAMIAEHLAVPPSTVERYMNQVLQSVQPATDPLAREAGYWYVRLQNPQITASERIDFRRWLDSAPAHLTAFHATELRWRSLLAPAQVLGDGHGYRQVRPALSLGGCSVAIAVLLGTLLTLGFCA